MAEQQWLSNNGCGIHKATSSLAEIAQLESLAAYIPRLRYAQNSTVIGSCFNGVRTETAWL